MSVPWSSMGTSHREAQIYRFTYVRGPIDYRLLRVICVITTGDKGWFMEGPGPPFFSVTDGSSMAVGLGSFWKEVIQIFCCGVYLELIPIRFHCKTWVLSRKRHWKVESHTIWTLHELSTLACKFITVGWCVDLSYKEGTPRSY